MSGADHIELRKAADSDQRDVRVTRIVLAELLAAYDALMSVGVKKSAKAGTYSPEFVEAWEAYPARPGNSKAAAFKAWKARIAAGTTPQQMIEGTIKYAAYCKAKSTEPEFVKQAATFFGPGEHFSADWSLPMARTANCAPPWKPSREQQQALANEEALRRLDGIPAFDPNTIDMEAGNGSR